MCQVQKAYRCNYMSEISLWRISLWRISLWRISLWKNLPLENLPLGESPFGESAFGESPFGESPFGESPFGESPFGESPFGESPFGDQNLLQIDQILRARSASGCPTLDIPNLLRTDFGSKDLVDLVFPDNSGFLIFLRTQKGHEFSNSISRICPTTNSICRV